MERALKSEPLSVFTVLGTPQAISALRIRRPTAEARGVFDSVMTTRRVARSMQAYIECRPSVQSASTGEASTCQSWFGSLIQR